MTRSEVENLLETLSHLAVTFYQDDSVCIDHDEVRLKKYNETKETILSALTSEPAAPMGFEEFHDTIANSVFTNNGRYEGVDSDAVRTLYNHMNHSADASKMVEGGVSFEFWTTDKIQMKGDRFLMVSLVPQEGFEHYRAVEVKEIEKSNACEQHTGCIDCEFVDTDYPKCKDCIHLDGVPFSACYFVPKKIEVKP